MSTIPTLIQHETASRLMRFTPRLVGRERERRKVTMVPEVHAWIFKPVVGEALAKVKAQSRAHFGEFVKGNEIDDLNFVKRVEDRRQSPPSFAHEVWSVSPRFDPPQYRYFGLFVTQDWFLVCTKRERDLLNEHDNRWHAEIDRTLRIWEKLFPGELPHSGNQLRDYVSNNARHLDDRW